MIDPQTRQDIIKIVKDVLDKRDRGSADVSASDGGTTYNPDSGTVVVNSPLMNPLTNDAIHAMLESMKRIERYAEAWYEQQAQGPRTGAIEGRATDNTRCAVIHDEDCNGI